MITFSRLKVDLFDDKPKFTNFSLAECHPFHLQIVGKFCIKMIKIGGGSLFRGIIAKLKARNSAAKDFAKDFAKSIHTVTGRGSVLFVIAHPALNLLNNFICVSHVVQTSPSSYSKVLCADFHYGFTTKFVQNTNGKLLHFNVPVRDFRVSTQSLCLSMCV